MSHATPPVARVSRVPVGPKAVPGRTLDAAPPVPPPSPDEFNDSPLRVPPPPTIPPPPLPATPAGPAGGRPAPRPVVVPLKPKPVSVTPPPSPAGPAAVGAPSAPHPVPAATSAAPADLDPPSSRSSSRGSAPSASSTPRPSPVLAPQPVPRVTASPPRPSASGLNPSGVAEGPPAPRHSLVGARGTLEDDEVVALPPAPTRPLPARPAGPTTAATLLGPAETPSQDKMNGLAASHSTAVAANRLSARTLPPPPTSTSSAAASATVSSATHQASAALTPLDQPPLSTSLSSSTSSSLVDPAPVSALPAPIPTANSAPAFLASPAAVTPDADSSARTRGSLSRHHRGDARGGMVRVQTVRAKSLMSFSNLLEAERARRYRRNHDSDEDDDDDDDGDGDGDEGSDSDDVDGGDGDGSRDGEEEEEEEAVEAYEDEDEHARQPPRVVRKEGGADRRNIGKQRRTGRTSRLVGVAEEEEDEDNENEDEEKDDEKEKEKAGRPSTRANGTLTGASAVATQGSRPSLALPPVAPTTRGLPVAPSEPTRHRLASDEAGDEDEDEDDNDTVGDEDSVRYVHDTDRIGDFLHISPRPSAKEKSVSEGPSSSSSTASSSSSASSTSVGAVFTFAAADVGEQSSTSLTTVPRVPSSSTTVPAVTEGVETESMASRGPPLSQRAPHLEVEIDPREHELHPRAPSAVEPTELAGSDPGVRRRSPVEEEEDHFEDEDDFDDYVDEWDAQGNRVTSRASAADASQPSSGVEASPALPLPSLVTASSFTAGMVLVPGPDGAWLWQSLDAVHIPEAPSTRVDTTATAISALLVGGIGATVSEPTGATHTESLDARVRDAIGTVAPVARSVEHVREKPGVQLSSPGARIPSPLTSTRRRVRALDPEDEPEDAERPLERSPARPWLGLTAPPSTTATTTATTARGSTATKMTPVELEASSSHPAVRPPSTAPSYTSPSSGVVDTSAIEMALGIALSPTSQQVFSVDNESRPATADGSVAGGLQDSRVRGGHARGSSSLPVPGSAWPVAHGSWTAPEASDENEDEFDAPSLGDLGYAAPVESSEGDEDEASPGATDTAARNAWGVGVGVAANEDVGEKEEDGASASVGGGTSLLPDFAGSALVLRDPGFLDDVWSNDDHDENPAESTGALWRAEPSFAAPHEALPHEASPHKAVAALLSLRSEFAGLRDRWLAVRAAEMELDETRVRAAEHVRALRARVADEAQAKLGVQARWLERLGRDVRLLETHVGRVAADARAEGSPWAHADHPGGGTPAMIEQ